ncbi:MAG: alkaline phosphatase family protein [Acidobacteria bacterium]|nr:alkaline phosphatase family protein [Acidobacteriota bacterium]
MRYLRMLTNAIVAGVLAAVYLTVVVLLINPQVPLISRTAGRWFLALVSFYGLNLSVAVYLAILLREVFVSRPLRPGWLSIRLLAWLGAMFAAATALITWANLQGFRSVLGEVAAERMWTAAVAATVCAVVLGGVVVLRFSFGRTGTRAAGVLLVVALVASVAVPLWVRGFGDLPVPSVPRANVHQPPGAIVLSAVVPHVRLILLDGAAPSVIRERVAAGGLPNFGYMLDRGALMDLATLKPTQAEPVWTAAATGKYSSRNGVRSRAVYRTEPGEVDAVDLLPDYCFAYGLVYQGYVTEDAASAESVRARTFWDIAGGYGLASGIVRWPLTYPARLDRGYLISDRFHLGSSSPLRLADARAGVPTSAVEIARDAFDAAEFPAWTGTAAAPPAELESDGGLLARWDRVYQEVAFRLESQFAPKVTATRYQGLDALSHIYWNSAEPGQFRRTAASSSARAKVLDDYYGVIDEELGRSRERLGPNDLLMVVSGFGMDRVSLSKRILARILGQPDLTGSHEDAPDGFLLAYGPKVVHAELPRGAIVDVAPTVLYYLGLPVGRDMDGFARSDIFVRSYRREHPVAYISTHER